MNFNESRYSLFLNIVNGATHKAMDLFEKEKMDTEVFLNKFEWTPLHTAAFKGNIQLVEYLLSKGARKEAVNKSGYTPHMLAAMNGHHDVKELLGNIEVEQQFIEVESYSA